MRSLPPLLQLSHIQPPQLHNAMTHAITKTTHFTTAGTSCGSIGLCNTSSRVTVINKVFAGNLHWDQVVASRSQQPAVAVELARRWASCFEETLISKLVRSQQNTPLLLPGRFFRTRSSKHSSYPLAKINFWSLLWLRGLCGEAFIWIIRWGRRVSADTATTFIIHF
jgi:hypothetical protein